MKTKTCKRDFCIFILADVLLALIMFYCDGSHIKAGIHFILAIAELGLITVLFKLKLQKLAFGTMLVVLVLHVGIAVVTKDNYAQIIVVISSHFKGNSLEVSDIQKIIEEINIFSVGLAAVLELLIIVFSFYIVIEKALSTNDVRRYLKKRFNELYGYKKSIHNFGVEANIYDQNYHLIAYHKSARKSLKNICKKSLKDSKNEKRLVIIYGKQGIGKTTILEFLERHFLSSRNLFYRAIPIHITLSDFEKQIREEQDRMRKVESAEVKFWKDWLKEILGKVISEDAKEGEAAKKLVNQEYERGHILFLFDAINEIPNFVPDDDTSYILDMLKILVKNNSAIITMQKYIKGNNENCTKVVELIGMDNKSIYAVQEKNSLIAKEVIQIPFFYKLYIEIVKKESNSTVIDSVFALIDKYIRDNIKKDSKLLENIADDTLKSFQLHYKYNQEVIFSSESKKALRYLGKMEAIKPKKTNITNNSQNNDKSSIISFWHSLFWDYFLSRGLKNLIETENITSNIYMNLYSKVSKSKDVTPLKIAQDSELSNSFAMFFSQDIRDSNSHWIDFLRDVNQIICDKHEDKEAYKLIKYIICNIKNRLTDSNKEVIDFIKIICERVNYAIDKSGEAILYRIPELITMFPYCTDEIKRGIIKCVFNKNVDWMKDFLMDKMHECMHPDKEKYPFDAETIQRIKSYFITQYIPVLMKKRKVYEAVFKDYTEIIGFIRQRYFDLYISFFLYASLLGLLLFQFIEVLTLLSQGVFGVVVVAITKLFGFLIIAVSLFAWIKQWRYSVDEYLFIFGKASEWMSINEFIRKMKGDKWALKRLFDRIKVESDKTDDFLVVLTDWIKNRPSIIFLLGSLILCLWPSHFYGQNFSWLISVIIIPAVVVFCIIPITSHSYIKRNKKHTKNKKWVIGSLIGFYTLLTLLSLGLGSCFFALFVICFISVWIIGIDPIRKVSTKMKKKDEKEIKSWEEKTKHMTWEQREKDITVANNELKKYFNSMETSKGQITLIQSASTTINPEIDSSWEYRDPIVLETFYELGITINTN